MSYDDDNSLIQEIREKYGTERIEGTATSSRVVQDGVRSSITESGQSGEPARGRTETDGRKTRKARRDAGVARGSYRRKGRTDPAPNKGNRRDDSNSRPVDGKIQLNERESSFVGGDYAKEEKPSGIAAKPNAKERKIREQAEQEQAARAAAESARAEEQAAPHFFRWLRLNNKRKDNKGEKDKPAGIRTKPLSTKEAEEIREPLVSALGDYFHYADELLSGTSANGAQAEIWGTLDDEEIGILVDAWLARAQKDPRAAHLAVRAVNMHYELKVGLILAPRFYKTFRFYVDNGMRSPFPNVRRNQRAKQRRSLNIVSTNN